MSKQFLKVRNGISAPGLSADPSDPANGDLYYNTTSNVFRQYLNGVWSNVGTSSTSGTVTSVAATVPAFLSIAGSPVTSSGTLAISLSGTALPVLNGGTGTTTSTGSGNVVLSSSPTLVTPILGVAAATSLNKMAITAPATSSTLAIADGKTFTSSNTLTLTATDGSTLAIGAGGTLGSNAYTSTTFAPLASPTFSGNVGIIGALSTAQLAISGTTTLSGVIQNAVEISMTGTNAASTSINGFRCAITSAASFTTPTVRSFFSLAPALGAAGTITRFVGFHDTGAAGHIATNNASLSDNITFTGNYFLNQTGTDPSVLAGSLTVPTLNVASTTTSVGSAWTAYTPTITSAGGTITTATATGRYQQIGKIVCIQVHIAITNNGTGTLSVRASLPISNNTSFSYTIAGTENGTTGQMLQGAIPSNASDYMSITFSSGLYPGGTGSNVLDMNGTYESI